MAPNAGYVIAGYLVTALALGGYTLRLFARARTAKRRAGRSPTGVATADRDLRLTAEHSGRIRSRRSRPGPPR